MRECEGLHLSVSNDREHEVSTRPMVAMFLCAAAAALSFAIGVEGGQSWLPPQPRPDDFDWVQLKSGEWLKGELIAMYDEELEFDSEEFDEQTLDWEDVRQIRTANLMQVAFLDGTIVLGELHLDGDSVLVIGEEEYRSSRSQILSITIGAFRGWNFWSGRIGAGLNKSSGNTSQTDANALLDLKRRTPRDRVGLDYLGNFSQTDGEATADNQRAGAAWKHFTSDRFFITPITVDFYRDPFQNVATRWTLGAGVGYQVIDTRKVEWDIDVGLGYQRTRFDDVVEDDAQSEDTPALSVGTRCENELSRWLDFFFDYQFFVVNEASGTYTHHLWTGLEFDLFGDLDFDVSWVWDRIQDPRPGSDGVLPQQDDFRTIFGLSYSF